MQLHEKIQYLRKKNKMTQAELAEKIDVSRQAVQKWESGITSPDISKLPDIANTFQITVDALLDTHIGIEDMENSNIDEKPVKTVKNNSRSMLDYLLMIPLATAVFTGLIMFYMIGAIMVFLLLALSIISVGSIPGGIIMIIINSSNGAGAVLISISIMFFAAGLIYPLYLAGKWSYENYVKYAKILFKKLKKLNVRSLL